MGLRPHREGAGIDNATTKGNEMNDAIQLIAKAHALAGELTNFYADRVGREFDTTEEFCILVEWNDAINAAMSAALSIRSWMDVEDLDKMLDECNMWLDYWQEAA